MLRLTRAAAATLKRDDSVVEELRVLRFAEVFEDARLEALKRNLDEPEADKAGKQAVLDFIKEDGILLDGTGDGASWFLGGGLTSGETPRSASVALRDALRVSSLLTPQRCTPRDALPR